MTAAPIVVGVAGSPAGLRAVDLAVREAELRHRPLRLVHADTWATHPAWVDVAPSGPVAARLDTEPRRALREALDRVAATSSVAVTGEVRTGSPTSALVRESQSAALVVVGPGPVARNVATHAHCPVLVAREVVDPGGHVLVGVHGSAHSDAAVGFAFEAAALRGAELLALHTWTGPASGGPGDMRPLVYEPDMVEAAEARVLAESLAGWQTKYPDVVVHRRVIRARPGPVLVGATGRAQLVVVGAHGHRGVPGWLLGSTSHLLLHQARCPLAVVHAG
jgi:nucleotide-binding universal stress UspA family protein